MLGSRRRRGRIPKEREEVGRHCGVGGETANLLVSGPRLVHPTAVWACDHGDRALGMLARGMVMFAVASGSSPVGIESASVQVWQGCCRGISWWGSWLSWSPRRRLAWAPGSSPPFHCFTVSPTACPPCNRVENHRVRAGQLQWKGRDCVKNESPHPALLCIADGGPVLQIPGCTVVHGRVRG